MDTDPPSHGERTSPRERALVVRLTGLFMFLAGTAFVIATLLGYNLGGGFITALIALCGGGMFLMIAAGSRSVQNLVHGFLEKCCGR